MVIKSVDDCYISEAVVGYVILLFKETTAIMNLVDNYVLHFIWFLIYLKDKKIQWLCEERAWDVYLVVHWPMPPRNFVKCCRCGWVKCQSSSGVTKRHLLLLRTLLQSVTLPDKSLWIATIYWMMWNLLSWEILLVLHRSLLDLYYQMLVGWASSHIRLVH